MTTGCSVLPPTFRARIDGAVVRFPGTGDGVALLVLVSMVKVDMGAASSGAVTMPPVRPAEAYLPAPSRSSHPAPCASEMESSADVLWSRRMVKARRIAQVASSWQSPQGA